MKKPYEGHEVVYKRMKKKGVLSWDENQGPGRKAINADTKRFLTDALTQQWSPKNGRIIELGCGTGPILRWLCKRNFSGFGIDISKTAIAIAKEQSKGFDIRFKCADICRDNLERVGKFDLVVDGHCLHCIIRPGDRKAFLKNSFKLLKKDGLFIVMTMCSPTDRKIFSKVCGRQKLINHTIFMPFDEAGKYEGFRTLNGRDYMPTRKVLHWKSILNEIKRAGFKIRLLRYNKAAGQEPCGDLSVAAQKA